MFLPQNQQVCDVCQSRFLTIHSLNTHIKSIHDNSQKFVCKHCGKPFASKGQLNVHERVHNSEKPFICEICNKAFKHRESLVTHSTTHTKIKPYACENCSQTFSCVGNLIKHRKVRPNTCGLPIFTNKKICKRAGVKCVKRKVPEIIVDTPPENLENNQIITYDAGNEITIIQDDKQANQEVPYTDHQYIIITENPQKDIYESTKDFTKKEMKVLDFMSLSEYTEIKPHNEQDDPQEIIIEQIEIENETEEYLDETFEDIEGVSENEDSSKTEDDEILDYISIENEHFKCKLCPKIYSKRNISIKHLRKEHSIIINSFNYDNSNRYRKPLKTQTWKCEYCPKKYTSLKMVEKHRQNHGTDGSLIYKCPCCALYFSSIEEVENHQYVSHSDRLVCDICQKRFDHPEKLLSHRKYLHSENKKRQAKKYTFVCPLCGRNFNTKVALSDHERSNCGRDPIYKCQYCDKLYQSAGNLKIHLTIHTQELNFLCTFCPKKFRTKGQLTVHNRSHLNIKPFKCKYQDCNAEFAHRESLLTHHSKYFQLYSNQSIIIKLIGSYIFENSHSFRH